MTLPVSSDLYMRGGLKGQPTDGFYAPVIFSAAWGGPAISADALFGTIVSYAPAPGGGDPRSDVVDQMGFEEGTGQIAGFVVRTKAMDNSIGGSSGIINTGDSLSIMSSGGIYAAAEGFLSSNPIDITYYATEAPFIGFLTQQTSGTNIQIDDYLIIESDTGAAAGGGGTEGPPVRVSFSFQYILARGAN
jgi:hypothetical protein